MPGLTVRQELSILQDNGKWINGLDEQIMSWATSRPEVSATGDGLERAPKRPTSNSLCSPLGLAPWGEM